MIYRFLLVSLLLGGAAVQADTASRAAADMKSGRYDDAIALYQAELEYNPFNAVAANNLAVAYAMKRQYTKALNWLQKASRMNTSRQDIALNLETLEKWLEDNSHLSSNGDSVSPALKNILSPEPPAPW
ncbi:MAG: tetratricopeptide repeat protein [bacterium]